MSASNLLSAREAAELLGRLKGAIEEFAAREQKLELEYRLQTDETNRWLSRETKALEDKYGGEIREANARMAADRAAAQTRFERRKARIAKARQTSAKTAEDRIERKEGKRKYAVQKGTLDAEKKRDDNLARTEQNLAGHRQHLAENRQAFAGLLQRAQKAFRGYGAFQKLLAAAGSPAGDEDETRLLDQLRQSLAVTSEAMGKFERMLLPKLFAAVALPAWLALVALAAAALYFGRQQIGAPDITDQQIAIGAGTALALLLGGYFLGKSLSRELATAVSKGLADAWENQALSERLAVLRRDTEIARIHEEMRTRVDLLNQEWELAVREASSARAAAPAKIEEKFRRAMAKNERLRSYWIDRRESGKHMTGLVLRNEWDARKRQTDEIHAERLAKGAAAHGEAKANLQTEWKNRSRELAREINLAQTASETAFPGWEPSAYRGWAPSRNFLNAAKVGTIEVDVGRLAASAPADPSLAWTPRELSLPLLLKYPQQGSALFETTRGANDAAIGALNNLMFRLLATSPAGKLSFTIIDPIKLGQNFASIMHLADYEDNLINGRIWTQQNQIEERLGDLNEHMEKVIQMYLRNDYPTIAEYNLEAGNIAEKYHFVVVADFPANFSETALRRLLRIAASGARCGVYTLIHWDHRHPAPSEFFAEELRKSSVVIECAGWQCQTVQPPMRGGMTVLDEPPAPDFATEFLHKVGEASRGSNRVEAPFAQVAPGAEGLWSLETTEELRVPIGRAGATKLQYLAMGRATRQHGLVAGKTGSGKSTLFHVVITNLALWHSPEQVEFYLVDFKKGVEFKSYATHRLPHARVVAIESDREFALSVLQKLDDELRRRGDLFRKAGAQDIPGYKRAGGAEPMPRCLLIIDEFQEFFVEDDRISQGAAMLLDRIVRQGRAFGIHALLGSQTLGGAYTLARTTIGQMVIRIALQCNEADALLIMDENNPAPRLLSRPGEGIYNDMAGAVEGNSPFQAVWLSDEERDRRLEQVRALADRKKGAYPGPVVFEGNAPADVRESAPLRNLLAADAIAPTFSPRVWLGAPNSIKGPTEAVFQRRSGGNLLIVGQSDEAIVAMLSLSLVALAAQGPKGTQRFVVLDGAPPGSNQSAYLESAARSIPSDVGLIRGADLVQAISSLAEELRLREESGGAVGTTTFLIIHGLQNFKKLRPEDDFSFSGAEGGESPATQLGKIISEGPQHGIHVIATLDTFNNVSRFIGRKGLKEFEMRVLFQMGADDSASLCDDPKASALGLHRALLHNEHEGHTETFRPYSLPDVDWMAEASRELTRLSRKDAAP